MPLPRNSFPPRPPGCWATSLPGGAPAAPEDGAPTGITFASAMLCLSVKAIYSSWAGVALFTLPTRNSLHPVACASPTSWFHSSCFMLPEPLRFSVESNYSILEPSFSSWDLPSLLDGVKALGQNRWRRNASFLKLRLSPSVQGISWCLISLPRKLIVPAATLGPAVCEASSLPGPPPGPLLSAWEVCLLPLFKSSPSAEVDGSIK